MLWSSYYVTSPCSPSRIHNRPALGYMNTQVMNRLNEHAQITLIVAKRRLRVRATERLKTTDGPSSYPPSPHPISLAGVHCITKINTVTLECHLDVTCLKSRCYNPTLKYPLLDNALRFRHVALHITSNPLPLPPPLPPLRIPHRRRLHRKK